MINLRRCNTMAWPSNRDLLLINVDKEIGFATLRVPFRGALWTFTWALQRGLTKVTVRFVIVCIHGIFCDIVSPYKWNETENDTERPITKLLHHSTIPYHGQPSCMPACQKQQLSTLRDIRIGLANRSTCVRKNNSGIVPTGAERVGKWRKYAKLIEWITLLWFFYRAGEFFGDERSSSCSAPFLCLLRAKHLPHQIYLYYMNHLCGPIAGNRRRFRIDFFALDLPQ